MDNLNDLIVIGDRVLLRPLNPANQTNGGLYLPPSVKEREEVQAGIVVRVGPGYPINANQDFDHFLKEQSEPVQYIPLQVKEGDQALFLQKAGHEVEIDGEKYIIVNQSAVLMVIRSRTEFPGDGDPFSD